MSQSHNNEYIESPKLRCCKNIFFSGDVCEAEHMFNPSECEGYKSLPVFMWYRSLQTFYWYCRGRPVRPTRRKPERV